MLSTFANMTVSRCRQSNLCSDRVASTVADIAQIPLLRFVVYSTNPQQLDTRPFRTSTFHWITW